MRVSICIKISGIIENSAFVAGSFYVGSTVLVVGGTDLCMELVAAFAFCFDYMYRFDIAKQQLEIGMLSIVASFIQLTGYGTGFLRAWWKRCVLKKDEFAAFEKNFYK